MTIKQAVREWNRGRIVGKEVLDLLVQHGLLHRPYIYWIPTEAGKKAGIE